MDVPLWLSILLYALAAIAIAIVLYLLMLYAMRQALREPLAELRTARRRQEDLLRDISTSAAYLADVADVWAESEAERNAVSESEAERNAVSEREAERRPASEPGPADEVDAAREAFGPGAERDELLDQSDEPVLSDEPVPSEEPGDLDRVEEASSPASTPR